MDSFVIQEKAMIFILSLIFIMACAPNEKKNGGGKSSPGLPATLSKVSHENVFSSINSKDQFVLELIGNDKLSGKVIFTIINSSGELIYTDEFESVALLGYDLDPNASELDKIRYIDQRMEDFCNSDNFSMPAIGPKEKYDTDYNGIVNEMIWNEIKNDVKSIGFYYIIGDERQSWIVYHKATRKVIRYKTCC